MNSSSIFHHHHPHRSNMNHQERLSTSALGTASTRNICSNESAEDRLPLPTRSSSMRSNNDGHKLFTAVKKTTQRPPLEEDICLPPLMISASSIGPAPPAPFFPRHMIHIGAEESYPLVGTQETIQAHLQGETMDTCCIQCQQLLFCLRTATGVMCPECRSISPTEVTAAADNPILLLGIGLTLDHVLQL
jgi:hypothetical protein